MYIGDRIHQRGVKTKERWRMMETSTMLSAQQWAEETFGEVRLGHRSREERAVTMAAAIAVDPAASLPKQMGSEAEAHAAYRFLQTPQVSYEQLIGPHLEQTRADMGKPERVLLIQDTTEVDYQQHPTTTGLGPVGNGTHHGFLLQTVLAVEPTSRQVLGIAHQEPFRRQPAPKGETRRQREQRERESQVWERSVQAIGEPPAGVQWIHVGDRYSDMFPFLWASDSSTATSWCVPRRTGAWICWWSKPMLQSRGAPITSDARSRTSSQHSRISLRSCVAGRPKAGRIWNWMPPRRSPSGWPTW